MAALLPAKRVVVGRRLVFFEQTGALAAVTVPGAGLDVHGQTGMVLVATVIVATEWAEGTTLAAGAPQATEGLEVSQTEGVFGGAEAHVADPASDGAAPCSPLKGGKLGSTCPRGVLPGASGVLPGLKYRGAFRDVGRTLSRGVLPGSREALLASEIAIELRLLREHFGGLMNRCRGLVQAVAPEAQGGRHDCPAAPLAEVLQDLHRCAP